MNITLKIIISVVTVILSGFFGWLIAKLISKRKTKRIDKQINIPETIESIKKQLDEQEVISMAREVRENDRRRTIFRGYGDRTLIPIDIGRREQITKNAVGQYSDKRADERRSELQDTNPDKVRKDEQPTREPKRDIEEDEQEFSWNW